MVKCRSFWIFLLLLRLSCKPSLNPLFSSLLQTTYITLLKEVERVFLCRIPWPGRFEKFYPREYEIGKQALRLIAKDLEVQLEDDEAASVALHFVNAQKDAGLHEKDRQMTQIVVGISEIVRLHFGYDLEEDSFSYNRFMTHLQYLAQRIVSGVSGGKNDAFLYEQVKINYPESFICTQKIAAYIKTSYVFELSLDEQVFLTIHIQRLKDNLDK